MRDPFVFVHGSEYCLYGTTDADCWRGPAEGFDAYVGDDLENWRPAGRAFAPSEGFWGTQNFWAPELHEYRGGFYLFASFKSPGRRRATAILKAESPLGPFKPWGEDQATPRDWECLDGTLHVDGGGMPWIVFSHEWVQLGDGTVCARRLREDLSGPADEPVTLFSAADAKWPKAVRHSSGVTGRVTDGPFLYKPRNGQLWMLWSSLTDTGYGIGLAVSESGGITGPWRQRDEPVYRADGGHGMVFRGLDGVLRLSIHTPNDTPNERPIFLPLRETDERLEISSK
jgi:beta-xylosidase